jgi:hypothetical protein
MDKYVLSVQEFRVIELEVRSATDDSEPFLITLMCPYDRLTGCKLAALLQSACEFERWEQECPNQTLYCSICRQSCLKFLTVLDHTNMRKKALDKLTAEKNQGRASER